MDVLEWDVIHVKMSDLDQFTFITAKHMRLLWQHNIIRQNTSHVIYILLSDTFHC